MQEDQPVVHIIDDSAKDRLALSELVSSLGYQTLTYSSAQSFLSQFDAKRSGCILVDVCMPEMTGFELFDELKKRDVIQPVIISSAFADVPMAVRALGNGAFGFMEKPRNTHQLVRLINEALEKYHELRQQQTEHVAIANRIDLLTEREHDVLEQLVDGYMNKQIASTLKLSVRTIEAHRASIMEKLQVNTIAALIKMVLQYRAYRTK